MVKLTKLFAFTCLTGYLLAGKPTFANENTGLTPGMTIGIGGDIGFAINENSDFNVAAITTTTGSTTTTSFAETTFKAKRDSAYGGNATFGYLMENGLSTELEIGYRQIKLKDADKSSNYIESDVISGLINVLYHLDLNTMVYPYVKGGVGIGRIKANGSIYDATGNKLTFDEMKENRFAYQLGAGISTFFNNVELLVGYKFYGFSSVKDTDSLSDMTASTTAAAAGSTAAKLNTSPLFNWGKLSNNVHSVEAAIKLSI